MNRMRISSLNGVWAAEAEVLATVDGQEAGGRDWTWALDPLRRPRSFTGPDSGELLVAPRTWMARVRLRSLLLELPSLSSAEPEHMIIDLAEHTPPVSCVLDAPETVPAHADPLTTLDAVATALELAIELGSGARAPDWVHSVRIRGSAGEGSATLAEILSQYFDAPEVLAGDQLLIDADGLAYRSRRKVPWWDPERARLGWFRYHIDRTEASRTHYRLLVERSPAWLDSLRRFQGQAVSATARVRDPDGMPSIEEPGIGLTAASLPEDIVWHYSEKGWEFTLGSHVFEVEIRGVANAAARWAPAAFEMTGDGLEIHARSPAEPWPTDTPDAGAMFSYSFDRNPASDGGGVESGWHGNARLAPDPASLRSTLQILSDSGAGPETSTDTWLLTETGALNLALVWPDHEVAGVRDPSQGLLRGALTLGQVPWPAQDTGDGNVLLAPDFADIRGGRLLIMDAGAASAALRFSVTDRNMKLERAELTLYDPELRADGYLLLYVPPARARRQDWSGPPPMPRPHTGDGAPRSPFIDVPLERANPADTGHEHRFDLRVVFQPGRVGVADEREGAREGLWRESAFDITLSQVTAERATYWFRPAGMRWIPSLPWYADPRRIPDERIAAERTYMPFRPRAGQIMTLIPGSHPSIQVMRHGWFQAAVADPGPDGRADPAAWVSLELPGMAFALAPQTPIRIRDGRPAEGMVAWLVRSGLPLLDELHALRVLEGAARDREEDDESAPALVDRDWWQALTRLASLAQAQRDIYIREPMPLNEERVLWCEDAPVSVAHLYARQEFPGLASLDVLAPSASLQVLTEGAEPVALIHSARLLEGPSARFAVENRSPGASPVLIPKNDPSAPVEIRAGSLVPHSLSGEAGRSVFDQSGRVSQALGERDDLRGRRVFLPRDAELGEDAPAGALVQYFQWSQRVVDLSSTVTDLVLGFVALPLLAGAQGWHFDHDSAGSQDDVLREFSWYTVGPTRLWGLRFQIFRLDHVGFPVSDPSVDPELPDRIVLTGVLHARDTAIDMADPANQAVQVAFVRHGDDWSLDDLRGHVLWPLFEPSPDLSDARREDLSDPLPWIEAPVELDLSNGPLPRLRLGRDADPASVVLRFLERSFALALDDLVIGQVLAPGAVLHFTVRPASEPENLTIDTIGGRIALALEPTVTATSTLSFRAWFARPAIPERPLAELELTLEMAREHIGLQFDRIRFLAMDDERMLAEVSSREVGDVEISAQRISVAVGLESGFRADAPAFEMLPGWPVDDQAGLRAYLTMEIASPPASGRVANARIGRAQLLIEAALATPEPVSALLSFAVSETGQTDTAAGLSIALTGQIRARSDIQWINDGKSHDALVHDVVFTLHQAMLPGDRLGSAGDARAFFTPRFIPNDETGLAGMIELWCLACHTVRRRDGDAVVLSWTAPQRLRLAAEQSFRQEVLLRGRRELQVLSVSQSPGELLFQYRPTTEEEQGFVGPLGQALAQSLASADTMILEATDAFWLRPMADGYQQRAPAELWRDRGLTMLGLPTRDTDFHLEDDAHARDWVRLPMPFLTDTRGVIHAAASSDPALARMLENQSTMPVSGPVDRRSATGRAQLIPRESLLHRTTLDRYSLRHPPPHPGMGAPVDPVFLQPEAFARLLPYVRPIAGFEPGWLVFHDWGPTESEAPFAATADVLVPLIARLDSPLCVAATELVPEARSAETSWQRVLDSSGRPRPYLLASPVIDLRIASTERSNGTAGSAEMAVTRGRLVRILVELWTPALAWNPEHVMPVLAARAVFYIGLSEHDTWCTILFDAPESPESQSPVRAAVRAWLKERTEELDPGLAPLVRVRALSPDDTLPVTGYFLSTRSTESGAFERSRRGPLAVIEPLRMDPRLKARTQPPMLDPLWLGPDYLHGKVYYEPSTEFASPDPTGNTPAVPAAGSALGLVHKIAGTAPGPYHSSRQPRTQSETHGHRWIEIIRDLMFEDRTRRDGISRYEPGWLLPDARIPTWLDENARRNLHPFLGTRVVHIHTAGRPGEFVRMRTALLLEDADGALRRTASMAHEMRHPRPVPLPPALAPFDPTQEQNGHTARRNTCRVETSGDIGVVDLRHVPPFAFARLEWQDPVYNRRLLAVGQTTEGDGLTLVVDRSIYAGVDVVYPELRMAPDDTDWTSIELAIAIQREQAFRLVTVQRMRYDVKLDHRTGSSRVQRVESATERDEGPDISARVVEPRGVSTAPDRPRRWVWEIGLDQPEADDGYFDFKLENQDQLWVEAIIERNGSRRRIHLSSRIRTDLQVWPQPQSAYAVLRETERTTGESSTEVAAFGWLPKPVVIKRMDRFRAESWRGTFRHIDAYVPGAAIKYEIVSVTSLGEQTGLSNEDG